MAERSQSLQGFAASIETARHELDAMHLENEPTSSSTTPEMSNSPATPGSPVNMTELSTADSFAFAFDIDGVLVRGGRPIPEAIEAMRVLNGENEYGMKVPYIFLTNGGGKTEAERCIDLSGQLDIVVSPAQFICGHTPMREMVEKYKTVLIVGGEGEKCRQVAEGYGFRDVITPGDIIKDNEATTPFRKLTPEEQANSRIRNYGETKIEAIFVFADSRDWAGDVQIMLDLAMSKGGYIGTLSDTFDEGPPIYFSHNDIVWSAAHDNVRLGMGALRKTVETLFKNITSKDLETIAFGKPQIGTFQFATRLLQQWRKDEHRINRPPETVYFVGDTPESDIRGTNEFNEKAKNTWYSILVRTGVYQEGTEPAYKPQVTVDTVLDAVKHGMKREVEKKKAQGANSMLPLDNLELKALSLDGEKTATTHPRISILECSGPNTPAGASTPIA
ncbi:putative cat eye syndrome critical region protein 5 [Venustampulla echinocandica]|uniref:Putative cat eye syndrome critical region protein 5 n=1 Tax=Venustampulla echinocandica TaxID=2656787 RepID=A0A370TXP9_9HELO|nr:putative cat eye syndrome critical region protein 5 [Venustampulla echinocandica]RDL40293.1 putative cat eye syndrome critical region protein 5 [Venustampulla echinocandica]